MSRANDPIEIIPPDYEREYERGYQPLVAGVLGSRLLAYFVDLLVIGLLVLFYGFLAGFLGFLTFGFTWLFVPIMLPLVALFYNGLTLSGPYRATWGMRLAGIEMRMRDGSSVSFLIAAVHAVLFYVLNYCFTPIILLFGLFRSDRRLAHDLLTDTVLVRTIRFVM
jgi:uncharacterized RDD family membrane protein YckC